MTESSRLGALLVILFLIMANANAVFSGWLLQSISPFTLLFWGFLTTTLFFFARLCTMHGISALQIPRSSVLGLVALNFFSGVSWIGYYYALKYIEPAIVSAIMGCVGPLFIFVACLSFGRDVSVRQAITSVGIIFGTVLLAWASISNLSAVHNSNQYQVTLGLAAALIGGLGQVMTTLSTKELAKQSWNASQIMAHRFYLLITVSAIAAINDSGVMIAELSDVASVGLVTILGIIVPLWLLQRGIIMSSPFTVSVLLALGPLVTLTFQILDSRLTWSNMTVMGCGIIVISTINNFTIKKPAPALRRVKN
ncbi:DMT family transporter [Pseudomonas guariconensis]|uniref:DMT family transporter n=1 Tax=Pseudomonas guariconensis TaxID=1288410 RepID=UPI0018A93BEE|nr:DMT family transporter [Pseudomonas guariconensis]MBF8742108.1 DMT family transporter [Pseudomonas guariconensis]MBF8751104.1 DMT family transporter [Pseudomonas guariconensis]